MKKVIRLTESDLMRIVKRVISEQSTNSGIKVKKVYIKKYGNPGWGSCLQNPNLNKSCDSGESFVELEDGTKLKYPNITFSSWVENGTYEGEKLKSLTPPYIVSFKLNNKDYDVHDL